MLMTGSRQHLFTEAMQHMEDILKQATEDMARKDKKHHGFKRDDDEQQPLDDAIVSKITLEAAKLKMKKYYTVLDDACKLAEELLLGIKDDNIRWELMYRVWVGMLCYSASMCRGYLHAKSLGEGGEFLSYVWLIISLKGAKTLADKLQMPDPEPEPKEADTEMKKEPSENELEDISQFF